MKLFNFKNSKGFTLIELMVSTSLFTIIALGGISILLSSERAYERVTNNRVAVDNTNLVVDSMSRELKFGSRYGCVNVSNGRYTSWSQNITDYSSFSSNILFDEMSGFCNAVAFSPENSEDKKIIYYFNTDQNTINQAEYTFNNLTSRYNLTNDYTITSNNYSIKNFWVEVNGGQDKAFKQPSVFIFMSGIVSLVKNNQSMTLATSSFALESFVSQRILDN